MSKTLDLPSRLDSESPVSSSTETSEVVHSCRLCESHVASSSSSGTPKNYPGVDKQLRKLGRRWQSRRTQQ